jgi:hypothetical protein
MCKNIHQSGRPVVLFGAGMGVPANLEGCVEQCYFSAIHYLILVCSDEVIFQRLTQRPAWRGTGGNEFIEFQQRFNEWFVNYNKGKDQPPITLFDTSHKSSQEASDAVLAWIREHQPPQDLPVLGSS